MGPHVGMKTDPGSAGAAANTARVGVQRCWALLLPVSLFLDGSCSVGLKAPHSLEALAPPLLSVCSGRLPGVNVDVAVSEVGFQCVPVPLQRPPLGTMPLFQLSIQQHLWDSVVVHPHNMTGPAKLGFNE